VGGGGRVNKTGSDIELILTIREVAEEQDQSPNF